MTVVGESKRTVGKLPRTDRGRVTGKLGEKYSLRREKDGMKKRHPIG